MKMIPSIKIHIMTLVFLLARKSHCITVGCGNTQSSICNAGDDLWFRRVSTEVKWYSVASMHIVSFEPAVPPFPCCSQVTVIDDFNIKCTVIIPPNIVKGVFTPRLIFPDFNNFLTSPLSFSRVLLQYTLNPSQPVADIPQSITVSDTFNSYSFVSGDAFTLRAGTSCASTQIIGSYIFPGPSGPTARAEFIPSTSAKQVVICYFRSALSCGTSADQQPILVSNATFEIFDRMVLATSPSSPFLRGFPLRIAVTCTSKTFNTFSSSDLITIRKQSCVNIMIQTRSASYDGSSGSQRVLTVTPDEDGTGLVVCLQRGTSLPVQIGQGQFIDISSLQYGFSSSASNRVSAGLPTTLTVTADKFSQFLVSDVVTLQKDSCASVALTVSRPPLQDNAQLPTTISVVYYIGEAYSTAVVCLTRKASFNGLTTDPVVQVGAVFQAVQVTYTTNVSPVQDFPFSITLFGIVPFLASDAVTFKKDSCNATEDIGTMIGTPSLLMNTFSVPYLLQSTYPSLVLCIKRGTALSQIGSPILVGRISYTFIPAQLSLAVPFQLIVGPTGLLPTDQLDIRIGSCNGDSLVTCPNGNNNSLCVVDSGGKKLFTAIPSRITDNGVVCVIRGSAQAPIYPLQNTSQFLSIGKKITYTVDPAEPLSNFPFTVRLYGVVSFDTSDIISLRMSCCENTCASVPLTTSQIGGNGINRTLVAVALGPATSVVVCLSRAGLPQVMVGKDGGTNGFNVVGIAVSFSRRPARGFAFTAQITGTTQWTTDDKVYLGKDDCGGAPVQLSNAGIQYMIVGDGTLSATLTPIEEYNSAVICLIRNGNPGVRVGALFSIVSLGYKLLPSQPSQNMQVRVEVNGADDFNNNDIISVRKESCAGDSIRSPYTPVLSGSGKTRAAVFTPQEEYNRCAVCLSRDNGPNRVQVGALFSIASSIQYSLFPSQPTLGVCVRVSLSGVQDFSGSDNVTVKRGSCDNTDIKLSNDPVCSVSNTQVACEFMSSEIVTGAVVCLSRSGLINTQVGNAFDIKSSISYMITPSADPVIGMTFTVTLIGVTDFASTDVIGLRKDSCTGEMIRSLSPLSVNGTGTSRAITGTPLERGSVAVCLQRTSCSSTVRVGPILTVGNIDITLIPSRPLRGMDFQCSLTGSTTFKDDDTITFNKDTCTGARINGVVTLFGSGTSRMASANPSEAYPNVVVCYTRSPGVTSMVGVPFAIANIFRKLTPDTPTRSNIFTATLFGDQNFDDFKNDDTIAVRTKDCSGPDISAVGLPILSNTVNMRSLSITPKQSCSGCVVCFKRSSGSWLRVGDPFDILEPFPVIVSYQCSSLYTSNSNPPVLCKNGDTLTLQGNNFDTFGETSIRFLGGTGPVPQCNGITVASTGSLSCSLVLQPGSGGQWGFQVTVNSKTCCASSSSCNCGLIQPYPSLSAVRGCGDQQSASIVGCTGGTLLTIAGAQFNPTAEGNAVSFQCSPNSQCSGTPPTCGPRSGPTTFTVPDVSTILCPLTVWADTKGLWAVQVVVSGITVPYNTFSLMAAQKAAPRVISVTGCSNDGTTNRGCKVGSTILVRGSDFDPYTISNNQIVMQCCPTCGIICIGIPICSVIAATTDTIACTLALRSLSINGRWSLSANVAGTMSSSSVSLEVAKCGDTELTSNEECDDGNNSVGDGCSMSCTVEEGWSCPAKRVCSPVCGDGERLSLEECDDGNVVNGDGCSSKCTIEAPTYLCNSPLNRTSVCVRCGDGSIQTSEECDDGNTVSGDGCSALCNIEAGWKCADRKVCTSICGDGIRTSAEQCDDKNIVSGDGCSARCEVEPYYSCTGAVGDRSVCQQVSRCGDGARASDESCDDGNTVNGDGCGTNCQVEMGWTCSSTVGSISQCVPICGDGKRYPPEECDDGNQLQGDGCSPRCTVESLFYCDGTLGSNSVCTTRAICGDGVVKAPEQCDDGGVISGDGCTPSCVIEPGWACTLSGSTSTCFPICGDGIRQSTEACDDGDRRNSDGCNTKCQIEADYVCEGSPGTVSKCKFVGRCGDGSLNEGEFCDDGNTASGDGCSPSCAIEMGWQCSTSPQTASVCVPVCGDNVRIGAEQCDDGNRVGGDGCSAACEVEKGYSCVGAFGQRSICTTALVCGDKKLGDGEQCDDGNQLSGDGCSPSCMIEMGWNCTGLESGGSRCFPICGDSVRMPAELCDDGNLNDGDGCTRNCTIELGFYCGGKIGSWSTCTLPALCGDGSRHSSESCDDGNILNGDGCDSGCQVEQRWFCTGSVGRASSCAPVCGDGYRAPVEECDDGDTFSGDGCTSTCRIEVGFQCSGDVGEKSKCIAGTQCGNNVRTPDEDCDDGNLVSGDGCSPACKVEQGWACTSLLSSSSCVPVCGDGRRLSGEECDDANSINGDGCSNICTIESGFQCVGAPSSKSTCTKRVQCGDGIRAIVEECDDGNTNSGDGCSPSCTIELGYACTNTMSVLSVCYTVCGDGFRGVNEQCDDGNLQGRDGCSSSCIVEPGWKCLTVERKSVCSTKCGDGIVATIEKCDDGNLIPKDGCSEFCDVEAGYSCTATPGLVSVCTSVCGDGIRGVTEACDDFNLQNGDGCNALCSIEQGWSCIGEAGKTSTCSKVNSCGDGIRTVDEACDDGNVRSGDGCSPICLIESGFQCSTIHGLTSECHPLCGDGIRFYNEECDDGNTTDSDGCSAECEIEKGFQCSGTFFHTSRCYKACGDGRKSPDEECDDGNVADNDGCSSSCKVELPTYDCLGGLGALSQCNKQFCGDGKLSSSEECDDRNQLNGDGCDSQCKIEKLYICDGSLGGKSVCIIPKRCGDAKRHQDEQCDDGNYISGDGCGACFLEVGWSCTSVEGDQSQCSAICGDGLRQLSEDCDDGNRASGDGCTESCKMEPGYMCLAPVGKQSVCARMLDNLSNVVAMPLSSPPTAPSGTSAALTIALPIVLSLFLLFCVVGCIAYWCKFKGQVRYFTGPGFRFGGESSDIPIVRTLPSSPSILKTPTSINTSISPPLPQHESTLTRSVPELTWYK